MNFGIDTYLSVHYYDHTDESKLRSFLSSVSGLIIINGLLLILLFSVLGYFLFQLIFPEGDINFFPYGFMSVITAFFNGYFRTYVNMQVFGDKPVKYFLLGLFNFCVTVIISLILIYQFPFELTGPMWGRFLSGCLIFLLTLVYNLREFGISFTVPFIKEIRQYATPVVIFSLLTWVLGYINNYILNAFETTSEVGIYDFGLKCTLLIEYGAIGLLSAINPRIYKLWKNEGVNYSTTEENKYNHVFSAFNILLISVNILVLPFIIRLFVTNEGYYESIIFLPILCASFSFRGLYNTLMNPLYYFKRTKVLPRIFLISAIIQIVSGIILIKFFGIWGAVWSYFLVKPLQLFFLWRESRRVFEFKFNIVKMLLMPMIYSFAVILITQIEYFSELQGLIVQLVIALTLVLIVYKNEVKGLRRLFTG